MLGVDPTDYFSKNHSLFKVNAFTFRLIFRTFFLMTQTLVAAIFLASKGDVLLDLQGLAGSFGMALMTFLLPSVMRLTLVDDEFSTTKRRNSINNRKWLSARLPLSPSRLCRHPQRHVQLIADLRSDINSDKRSSGRVSTGDHGRGRERMSHVLAFPFNVVIREREIDR